MNYEPQIIDGKYLRIYLSVYSHEQMIASTHKPQKNAFEGDYYFYDVPLPSKWKIAEVATTAQPRELKSE